MSKPKYNNSFEISELNVFASFLLIKYGTMMALGTVDAYPGEWPDYGRNQPGCYDGMTDVTGCSHIRAINIYKASISQGSCSASQKCNGESDGNLENCEDVELDKPVMGYWTDLSLRGSYSVDVTGSSPYCTKTIYPNN